MATKYSPAPWTRTIYRIQSRGETIAIVEPDMLHTNADANLMTAAPELLAALVAIRDCTFLAPSQPLSTPCQDCMDMVNTAIAKARGE